MNHLMTGSPGSSPLCPHIQIEKVSVVAVVLLLLLQLPSYDMECGGGELMKAVQCSHPLVTLVRWCAVQHSLQQSCQSVQSCSQVAAAVSGVLL